MVTSDITAAGLPSVDPKLEQDTPLIAIFLLFHII